MRRPIAERLSRSVIQRGHDFYEFIFGDGGEVSVFRKILTDETVRVFVHASLPGCIRMGKVDARIEILGHSGMITKLPAIVIRGGSDSSFMRSESTNDSRPAGYTFPPRPKGGASMYVLVNR